MTRLCVSIYVNDAPQALRDCALAAERGADMVELRVDTFTDAEQVKQLVKQCPLPCVVTCRDQNEGGHSALSDVERLTLLHNAAQAGASYLDIEFATVRANSWPGPQQPRDRRPGWIYSSHDFNDRPANLLQLMIDLAQSPCDVSKVAWKARSIRDNIEALDLMLQRHKPTAAICMGEAGLLSRVLTKKFGGFLTFASLDKQSATAPGQVTIDDLKKLYRWDAQQASTKIYGVVGSPVAHSMSPAIHNAAFDAVDFDGVYVPLLVEPSYEAFKAFMETFLEFESLHLSGLSITIPHKENALRYLKEKNADIDPLAERIGALNTIVISDAGSENPKSKIQNPKSLTGFSTDYPAILDCITSALSIKREQLKNYRVAVLGAGGTGRTAVAALAHYGATVVVYNRTHARAEELATEFNGHNGFNGHVAKVVAARMEKLCDSCCQIFINTTSVGMSPNVDASPFDAHAIDLNESHLVFDTIYNPLETKLLRHARERGAKTIPGIEMFVRQAAGQFEAWTQQPAPVELMRKVVTDRLNA